MPTKEAFQIDSALRQYIESRYNPVPRDEQEKLIDAVIGLMEYGWDRKQTIPSFLEQVARLIFRHFAFGEIVIGLYDRKRKDFYHEVVFGYRNDLVPAYKKIRYAYEDMVSMDRFAFIKTGKLSELDPVEGLPEEERKLFSRPFAGSAARKAVDEFHEGDYFDVWMMDHNKNIIGWIEMSGRRDGKLPPKLAVRWVEVIASICALVIRQRWILEDQGRS